MFEVSISHSEDSASLSLNSPHSALQVDEKPDKAELGLPLPRPHPQLGPAPPPVTSHAPSLSPVEKKPWLMVPTPILPPLPTLNFSVCQVRSRELDQSEVFASCQSVSE